MFLLAIRFYGNDKSIEFIQQNMGVMLNVQVERRIIRFYGIVEAARAGIGTLL
jgi:hypothetical protein